MRTMIVAAFLALGLMAMPVFAQDAKDMKDAKKKEMKDKAVVKANVYEATIDGMT